MGDLAEIHTRDGGRITAHKVIVTVPLNVLNSIEFRPGLSAVKVAAATEGQVSQGLKVWMRVAGHVEPFIALAPGQYPLTMAGYEYEHEGDSILVAFGPDSSALDVTDLEAVQAALAQWRPDLDLVLVDAHDWTADPLSGETWSMPRTGQISTAAEELQRPEGRVHLAGGDYASGWAGFIDGAIESGRGTARRVLTDRAHP
ncbi:flavin monoamine oxidase family protein [Streptomyces sp. NPDC057474]|uniref:flavin monoamine oxidase family protein n=1 Tax=Streptomyces sp. NPDC057474 TaxID=3346144 RepID=UPI00367CF4E9